MSPPAPPPSSFTPPTPTPSPSSNPSPTHTNTNPYTHTQKHKEGFVARLMEKEEDSSFRCPIPLSEPCFNSLRMARVEDLWPLSHPSVYEYISILSITPRWWEGRGFWLDSSTLRRRRRRIHLRFDSPNPSLKLYPYQLYRKKKCTRSHGDVAGIAVKSWVIFCDPIG